MPEPDFRRSSYCGTNACVEIATGPEVVLVRDSKTDSGPILTFSAERWDEFLAGVRDGEFDRR